MIEEKIKQLKKIKEKLNSQKLSVLIGAGFSLNVSEIFPTWWDLVYDIAYDLFKYEISNSYNIYLASLTPKTNPISENKFTENKITELIKKEGFLKIVSKYIKKQGIRESIATYIEDKVPKIEKREDKTYLVSAEKDIELTKDMLSQHNMLLQLPWNNIYTTNYDTLLEECVDINIEKELRERIINLEIENAKKHHSIQVIQQRLSKILDIENSNNIKIEDRKEHKQLKNTYQNGLNQQANINDFQKRKNRIDNLKSNINIKLDSLIREIKKNELTIQELNNGLNECLTIVKHSSDLSIKRNKNIIKLHGTLRSINDEFGFDGDIHKQYVIAKEDYETYPVKHEAFTQLMRISLLQESYVLIGFSGDDPNFISWISWVRDILERKPDNYLDDYKIYLIDVSSNPITNDKKLFYKNHRIVHIPLSNTEIINFLESESNYKIQSRESYKEIFELFFSFLSISGSINEAKYTIELLNKNEYKDLWERVKLEDLQKISFTNKIVNKIEDLKYSERVPLFYYSYFYKHRELLHRANILLNTIDASKKEQLSTLIGVAMQDTYLTPYFLWKIQDFEDIIKNIKGQFVELAFDKIVLREIVLNQNKDEFKKNYKLLSTKIDKDDLIYEDILMSAFSFDFKSLLNKLKLWNPALNKVINKAGFLALFNTEEAEKYLSPYSSNLYNLSTQEQLFALQLLQYIKQANSWTIDKELNQKIQEYKKLDINNFDDNIEYIFREFERKSEEKLKPYGDDRFSVTSNSMKLSNDFTKPQKGLQFIQLFIELGFPLCIKDVYYTSPEKWYLIVKSLYKDLPYPILFYTLQYSNEKFLRRVAQDYIYSDVLKEDISQILNILLDAYLQEETPTQFKRSILVFSSELFIASPPQKWQGRFFKIWQLLLKNKSVFVERYLKEKKIIEKALLYVRNKLIIQTIILDILNGYTENENTSIDYLYSLANNSFFSTKGEKLLNNEIKEKLNDIITSLPNSIDTSIFILGNLSRLLTQEQKKNLKNKLSECDLYNIKNERVWGIILYFSNSDEETHKKIKKAIIVNDKLWYSGIKNHSVSGNSQFINLLGLTKTTHHKNGLVWTKNEIQEIFNLLTIEFEKIKKVKEKRSEISFKFLLEEMYNFLIKEKNNLSQVSNYKFTLEEVTMIYREEINYSSLYEGLSSNDSSTVIWAINELFYNIYNGENKILYENELQLLLDKIILQKEPSLEACLNYIANFFFDYKTNSFLYKYKNQLTQILIMYQEKKLLEYDKPFVEEQLIKIAIVLDKWNEKNEIIAQWLNKKKETNFNNIRFNL